MQTLIEKATQAVINPIIQVIFAVALVIFVFGVFEFVRGTDKPEMRSKGQQHMIWGLIGLFIMSSVFAIIQILANTIGVDTPEILR